MTGPATERELILRREVPFPRTLVWKAMTEPEHVNRWWGPNGFRNEASTMDFRVGGAWDFVMVAPDGSRHPNHSVFKEITPPSRLVFDHGDGERMWFEMTVTLEETARGTLITLRQLYPTREARDEVVNKYGAKEGGEQHLAKLEAYLVHGTVNDELDLKFERVVDVSPERVFKAWTTPKHLMPWFCPKPYRTIECEIDLKPGGKFFVQMADPEGNKLPAMPGCYLEIVPDRKLVWTSALGAGYRPHDPASAPQFFTAVLTFEPHGDGGCRYTATALHATRAHAAAHEKMGFTQGWGKALEQLVEYSKTTHMD